MQTRPYVHTLSEQSVTTQRLATTGRGILFQILLNLGNYFVSSVELDAKEHFRVILTPKTPEYSSNNILFFNMTPLLSGES